MATKKKNSSKKHSFKHAAPSVVKAETATPSPKSVVAPAKKPAVAAAVASNARNFSYVSVDMRRVLIYGGLLIALELALWGVIDFTPFGQRIYELVRL